MEETTDDAVGDKGTREGQSDGKFDVIGIQDGGARGGANLYDCKGSATFAPVAKTLAFSVSGTCPLEVDGGITNGIAREYLDLWSSTTRSQWIASSSAEVQSSVS